MPLCLPGIGGASDFGNGVPCAAMMLTFILAVGERHSNNGH
jgi:hypothetical protein